MSEKRWQGKVNGFDVFFRRHDEIGVYVAEVVVSAGHRIMVHSDQTLDSTKEWRPARVNWSALGSCDVYETKLYAEALDVAWRIAAGMNEELEINEPQGIEDDDAIKPGNVKP